MGSTPCSRERIIAWHCHTTTGVKAVIEPEVYPCAAAQIQSVGVRHSDGQGGAVLTSPAVDFASREGLRTHGRSLSLLGRFAGRLPDRRTNPRCPPRVVRSAAPETSSVRTPKTVPRPRTDPSHRLQSIQVRSHCDERHQVGRRQEEVSRQPFLPIVSPHE